ncbi:MAG: hypothetical protein UV73_C0023G0003 [Candidatus Gottesmanbacteria bacterium GW2011_GWA2_43_14]|uniref:Mechanosensitive ion channel MscS domain-containing protein n=1 Tax=Candidatus Gottesmanbacteria bacterium GW2011_GWA2_43_14 TaxID=1618443 RepID=A0A0G1FJ04_9BACT|nr:MAG: hypothetical protein UV73_C0023G0003 [Candidatus Gottesmanbacteria bacterium GW2011_GWA2_43_14]
MDKNTLLYRLFIAAAIMAVALVLDKIQRIFIKLPKNISGPRVKTYLEVIHSFFTAFIFLGAGLLIIDNFQIDLFPVLASAGVLGIIIGLGIRPILEDFFTAIFMFTQDTVRIGDYVRIKDSEGWLESIGLRIIKIRDRRGALHIFPNREIKQITNYSRLKAEVVIDLPVKYILGKTSESLKLFGNALNNLKKQQDIGSYVSDKSSVAGIEEIEKDGILIIRTILISSILHRGTISRRFRFLVIQEFESRKINLLKPEI